MGKNTRTIPTVRFSVREHGYGAGGRTLTWLVVRTITMGGERTEMIVSGHPTLREAKAAMRAAEEARRARAVVAQ